MICYIAIEGIDGSGKDTQLHLLSARLDRDGLTPIILQEPSYGPHGRALRARLTDLPSDSLEQRALFTEDRRDHAARKILPALAFVRANPDFVLLQNRSVLSAAAYQPLGREDADLKRTIEEQLSFTPLPDLTIVLDVPTEVALQRISGRRLLHSLERSEILEAVRQRYQKLADLYSQVVLVDGTAPPDQVRNSIRDKLARAGLGEQS
ncbi:MAG TPA: dTMP kinase [Aurantimonas coralicida]|uniref:Thymidylate kinase n=2 Tax=root TaxID=1 RepID=A0A9C9TH81_9HYPH|nr:dTMP kinase [Aurantimonas coralicida]HEU00949.1 dTMP kinase [Aurantimonas coralicida]